MEISGWGQYPKIKAKTSKPKDLDELLLKVKNGSAIAWGNGRAYGDSAISTQNTIKMRHFSRVIKFNQETGELIAEAGILLSEIIKCFLPLGWFPFVTPGTQYVTLGGMIAADIHGKNHHKNGSFRKYVNWIDLVTGDGKIMRCSRVDNSEHFEWTIGGMGLTGIILRASIRLKSVTSAFMKQKTLTVGGLDQVIDILENSKESTYCVAWIDCINKGNKFGRSVVMLGEHADQSEVPRGYEETPLNAPRKIRISVPINLPSLILNRFSVKIFNSVYYWKKRNRSKLETVDFEKFFYPLDNIRGWNKLYGRKGFIQFQCVFPLSNAGNGLKELLKSVSNSDADCYLAVLKRFGKEEGEFSFPMKGYSLALDFPANERTMKLLEELDLITLKYNGRFYLAKDSRISKEHFLKSDERAKNFTRFRDKNKIIRTFCSSQSTRLGL